MTAGSGTHLDGLRRVDHQVPDVLYVVPERWFKPFQVIPVMLACENIGAQLATVVKGVPKDGVEYEVPLVGYSDTDGQVRLVEKAGDADDEFLWEAGQPVLQYHLPVWSKKKNG